MKETLPVKVYQYRSISGKVITRRDNYYKTVKDIREAFKGSITPLVSVNGRRIKK